MLQFIITNLQVTDIQFDVPSAFGAWEFCRTGWYDKVISAINDTGAMGNTYTATNVAIGLQSSDRDFSAACDELIDICLVLSFLNGRCVAPSGTTAYSQPQLMQLGDSFIRPRAIAGIVELTTGPLTIFFQSWLTIMYPAYLKRKFRLQLVHWLSGCTCFSLEDLYQSVGVQLDLVKQREIGVTGQKGMHYYAGMTSASTRYGIAPLSHDFTKMRNDSIHEGVLSGTNFPNKTKIDCSNLTADTLNWIDEYVLCVMGVKSLTTNLPRWTGQDINLFLPAITVS